MSERDRVLLVNTWPQGSPVLTTDKTPQPQLKNGNFGYGVGFTCHLYFSQTSWRRPPNIEFDMQRFYPCNAGLSWMSMDWH